MGDILAVILRREGVDVMTLGEYLGGKTPFTRRSLFFRLRGVRRKTPCATPPGSARVCAKKKGQPYASN